MINLISCISLFRRFTLFVLFPLHRAKAHSKEYRMGYDSGTTGVYGGDVAYGHKKRAPLSPTFVNLKSNTMKNTVQRYGFPGNLQIIQGKTYVL